MVDILGPIDYDKIKDKVQYVVDNAGLAKESTVEKLTGALQSINTDKFVIVIGEDDVGLAKDSTVDTLTKDTTIKSSFLFLDHIGDYGITVTNSGTAAAYLPAFSSDISMPDTGEYLLVLAIDSAAAVKLTIVSGTKKYSYLLNHGNALVADAWYVFDGMPLLENDAINLEIYVDAGATISGVLRVFKRR